jgi:DNA-binding GntR family transcriptional regulator
MRNGNGEKKGELSNGVYLKLKEKICSGALKPNETLNLYELARTFNTSVTPINSALKMLSEEGLVIKRPNKSAIVTSMSVEEVKRIWLTGALLEGMASNIATPRMTQDEMTAMEQLNRSMEDLRIPYDAGKFKDLNQEFHSIFLRACSNKELLDLIRESSLKLYRYYVLASSLQGAVSEFVTQHTSITDSLKRKDPKGTREAVEEHIISEGEKVIRCLELGIG